MALDFCILSANGHPEVTASFGTEDHARIFLASLPGSLMSRASEFYEDTEFQSSEIPLLLGELEEIKEPTPAAVEALVVLCKDAIRRGCGIVALAD